MSLSKRKYWHSNNCLQFLNRAVPLQICKIIEVLFIWPSYNSLARVERFHENLITFLQHFSFLPTLLQEKVLGIEQECLSTGQHKPILR
jgi:hypothetical protein